jgi:biopolymer transport protein TolQ
LLWQGEIWHLLATTGLVARIVLGLLLFASVFSWAIILRKYQSFGAARRASREFLKVFRQSKKLSDIKSSCRLFKASPLPEVFLAGYKEIESQAVTTSENPGKPRIRSLDSVKRALEIAASTELGRREQWLTWLATTGAVTPFIGLFGTVWGVMAAFHGIGAQGSASLAVVAPGISEALIATAAGLGAAIPAVIGYNYFVNRVKHWAVEMEGFTLDLLNLLSRPAKVGRTAKDGV